jgi:hypothetical protein
LIIIHLFWRESYKSDGFTILYIVNLFLNPSWITFRSNCHGRPKSTWLACIRTTSYITSSEYFPIANTINICLVTFTSLHSFNQCKSIRPRIFNTTQIQFLHKSITIYISTTTSINYHATYLVLDMTSSVKYVFPLLIYIIFFDLHVQCTPYNQRNEKFKKDGMNIIVLW